MKKFFFVLVIVLGILILISCTPTNNNPPTIQKVSGPNGNVDEDSQTFEWLGSDTDGTISGYEYKKDGGNWTSTTSTQYTWSSIAEGSHTFEVRAKDTGGAYSDPVQWTFNYSLVTYELTISITGNGNVIVSPYKDEYSEGENVTLTPDPDAGWEFSNWSGDLTGNDNPLNITMNTDKNITAVFTEIPGTPPTIEKVSGPNGNVDEDSQTFEWLGSDTDGTISGYEYKKDGGNWTSTTSTQYTWSLITEGAHTFEVKAVDNDGFESNIEIWSFTYTDNPGPTPDNMVLVTSGTFSMGDTRDEGYSDEKPVHEVTLSYDYYMGKYEVTNEEYCSFLNDAGVSSNGSKDGKELIDIDNSNCQIGHNGSNFYVESGKEDYPIIYVTWWGAIYYCNWLSGEEGLTESYNLTSGEMTNYPGNKGYRLPTEAEWEYTARGATNSPDYLYAGSDDIDEVGWYVSNSEGNTHEVGMKNPNGIGTYDMSGNVYEWCNDWYNSSYYSSSSSQNPTGPTSGSYRIIRGGGWGNNAFNSRVADRYYSAPPVGYPNVGFRICRTE